MGVEYTRRTLFQNAVQYHQDSFRKNHNAPLIRRTHHIHSPSEGEGSSTTLRDLGELPMLYQHSLQTIELPGALTPSGTCSMGVTLHKTIDSERLTVIATRDDSFSGIVMFAYHTMPLDIRQGLCRKCERRWSSREFGEFDGRVPHQIR